MKRLLATVVLSLLLPAGGQGQRAMEESRAEVFGKTRHILQQALAAAYASEDASQRSLLLDWIASLQARIGDFEAALDAVSRIEQEWERDQAWAGVARGQAEAGDLAGARETARRIKSHLPRDFLLQSLAVDQAQATQVERAREIARGIEEPALQSETLGRIALVQARANDPQGAEQSLDEALQVAGTAEDGEMKVRALSEIAKGYAMTGNLSRAAPTFDQALEVIARFSRPMAADSSRAEVVEAQARAGFVSEAFATARGIQDDRIQARALSAIARAQAEGGNFSGAIATVNSIPTFGPEEELAYKGSVFYSLAIQHLNARDVAAALAIAARLKDMPATAAEVLAMIGRQQAWRGDWVAANESFRRALEVAEQVEENWGRAQAIRLVAVSQAETGDVSGALRAAERIQVEHERRNVFSAIAMHQARLGDVAGALAWTANLSPPELRARALLGVAQGILARWQAEKARRRRARD